MLQKLIEMAKALAAGAVAAATSKAGTVASYNDVSRAIVLTPTDKDGAPMWRTKADGGTMRDAVIRVYVASDDKGAYSVTIGGHAPKVKGKRELATASGLTAEQAEKLAAATVVRLMQGQFADTLAKHVPSAPIMRTAYVVRPDTLHTGKRAGTVTVTVNDTELDTVLSAPADKGATAPSTAPKTAPK